MEYPEGAQLDENAFKCFPFSNNLYSITYFRLWALNWLSQRRNFKIYKKRWKYLNLVFSLTIIKLMYMSII